MCRNEFFFCYRALMNLWASRTEEEIKQAKYELSKVRKLYGELHAI